MEAFWRGFEKRAYQHSPQVVVLPVSSQPKHQDRREKKSPTLHGMIGGGFGAGLGAYLAPAMEFDLPKPEVTFKEVREKPPWLARFLSKQMPHVKPEVSGLPGGGGKVKIPRKATAIPAALGLGLLGGALGYLPTQARNELIDISREE